MIDPNVALGARALLNEDPQQARRAFDESLNNNNNNNSSSSGAGGAKMSTADLLAMLDQKRKEDEERMSKVKERRAQPAASRAQEQTEVSDTQERVSPLLPRTTSSPLKQASGKPTFETSRPSAQEPLPALQSASTPLAQASNPTISAGGGGGVPLVSHAAHVAMLEEARRATREALEAQTTAEHTLQTTASSLQVVTRRAEGLQKQVEVLEALVQEKHAEVQRVEADAQQREAEQQNVIERLEMEVQRKVNPKLYVREGALVSKEELEEVRSDVLMQEKIVKTLEKDNDELRAEKKILLGRIRQLEQECQTAESRALLKQEAVSLSHGPSPNNSVLHNQSSTAAAAGAGIATAELQLQLQKSKIVEEELRVELDRLKRELREAMSRASAVDELKVQEAQLESRGLRVQMQRKDDEHDALVKEMGRKISWYVEHQEFNRAQEDLIHEQQDTIQQLRLRVQEAESLVSKSGVVRTDKDKQIKQMQRHISELEAVIRDKYPNSIAQLIRSCQPPVQHSLLFRQMGERIKVLEAQLVERDEQAEAAIGRLRVEADKQRLRYESRISSIEEEMKTRLLHAQTRKMKELEKQLQDTRKQYSEKVKDMEQQLLLLRRGAASASAAAAGTTANASSAGDGTSTGRQSKQQRMNKPDASAPLAHPSSSSSTTSSGTQTAAESYHFDASSFQSSSPPAGYLLQENAALKGHIASLQQQLQQVHYSTSQQGFNAASLLQQQVSRLHGELATLKQLHAAAVEDNRRLQIQWEDRVLSVREDGKRALESERQSHAHATQLLREQHQQEMKLLLDRTESMRVLHEHTAEQLAQGGGSGPHSSHSSKQYLGLVAERLQLLEHRQMSRELDAKRQIEELQAMAQFELAVEREKHDISIRHKNQEITRFRMELDTLLADLADLRGLRISG